MKKANIDKLEFITNFSDLKEQSQRYIITELLQASGFGIPSHYSFYIEDPYEDVDDLIAQDAVITAAKGTRQFIFILTWKNGTVDSFTYDDDSWETDYKDETNEEPIQDQF